jgi:hypothetical protein
MPIQYASKKLALTSGNARWRDRESTIVPPMRYSRAANPPENPMQRSRIKISHPSRIAEGCSGLAAILAGALLLSTASRADDGAAGASGTWQSHKYTFQFMGFTSTYSCDGLADKLKIVLLAAGARPDVKSVPGACASGFGRPDKFARADLTFYTLTPADSGTAAGAGVQGVWRPITFASRQPRQLALGDCELMEQFRQQVLPMFTTRSVVNNTTCIPHQESGSNIDLRFESFTAVPGKKHATAGSGGPS